MLVRVSTLSIRRKIGFLVLMTGLGWGSSAAAAELAVAATTAAVVEDGAVPDASQASYQQVAKIEFTGKTQDEKLISFCLAPDGKIVALVTVSPRAQAAGGRGFAGILTSAFEISESEVAEEEVSAEPAMGKGSTEVRILDADGKLTKSWPLKFRGQAVNVSPDGQICVGGDGQLAAYNADGKLVRSGDAPQMPELRKDPDALRTQALEEIESRKTAIQDTIKTYEEALAQFAGKEDKDLSQDEREQKQQLEAVLKAYKGGGIRISQAEQKVETVMERLLAGRRRINALAVSDKHLFVTCGASKGYGYAVWRVDRNFENPKMIVKSLSGCCGQMDIQCHGDELVVAENSRHRVVRYNADGEELSSFGKRSRDGSGDGFGGCCNPMNLQARGDKLYVSESDGQVKLFQPDGEFLGLLGVAAVQPGCKSSSIGVAPDGKRIYYIDIQKSAILVLALKDQPPAKLN